MNILNSTVDKRLGFFSLNSMSLLVDSASVPVLRNIPKVFLPEQRKREKQKRYFSFINERSKRGVMSTGVR